MRISVKEDAELLGGVIEVIFYDDFGIDKIYFVKNGTMWVIESIDEDGNTHSLKVMPSP